MPQVLVPAVPVVVLVARAFAVYVFLVVVLRLAGRRETGQLSSFDLVLLLILSNAVQNSINAGDNTLVGGLISATALIAINWVVGWMAYRYTWFERIAQGAPVRIVSDGKIHVEALQHERITLEELRSALRKQGIFAIDDCTMVILEADGTLTAVRKDFQPRSLAELAHPDPVHVPRPDDPAAYGA